MLLGNEQEFCFELMKSRRAKIAGNKQYLAEINNIKQGNEYLLVF